MLSLSKFTLPRQISLFIRQSMAIAATLIISEIAFAKNVSGISDTAGTVGSVAQCTLNIAQACTPNGQASLIVTVGSRVFDISGAIQCIQGRANGDSDLDVIGTCITNIPGLPFGSCIGLAGQIAQGIAPIIAGFFDRCELSAPPIPVCHGDCQACCIDKAKKKNTPGCAGVLSARFCEDDQAYAACFLKCNCPGGHNIDPSTLKYGGSIGNCFMPKKQKLGPPQ